jgi:alkanesulfonate monooxygenase SsuD/methylene tetrahydromethanopterin reductase-like flavin-dependent oxidoreductase (luciferase family)
MRYGMILPGGTADEQLEQAVLAEDTGWDGIFMWEAAYGVDAWGLLSAIAARTTRITLGTALTPLPGRRPWKVASQVVTLDQISAGRAVLMVGLGAVSTDLPMTGEEVDLRTRAAMMDEGIDLVRALWRGGHRWSRGPMPARRGGWRRGGTCLTTRPSGCGRCGSGWPPAHHAPCEPRGAEVRGVGPGRPRSAQVSAGRSGSETRVEHPGGGSPR